MNLIIILFCITIGEKNSRLMSEEQREKEGAGYFFVWVVNVALDIYLISQLPTIFGG